MRAIITGAASGIGRATTRRFLGEGHAVLAVDQDAAGLEHLAGEGADTMTADLADVDQRAMVCAAAKGADVLVNSAGAIFTKDLLDVTIDEWRRLFVINAESIFFLCQQVGPTMPAGSAIVNLSSSSAKLASTSEVGVYAATKAAILSITRSFAYRLAAQGVRVNAICPGVIDTPMQEKVLGGIAPQRGLTVDELSTARTSSIPLARPGTPEETANLISFLCSSEASYMTGQAINITGGLVTW